MENATNYLEKMDATQPNEMTMGSSGGQKEVAKSTLETKEQLVQKIREWVKIDNELRVLQKEQINRKRDKKNISKELLEVMKMNQIDAFDLKDGQLVYAKTKTKKPITKKTLMTLLSAYFKGNNEKANELNTFLMENREEVVREQLVRKFDK